MANLPAKPNVALPSLYEARKAHSFSQAQVAKAAAHADTFEPSHQTFRYDRNTNTLQNIGARDDVVLAFTPEAPKNLTSSLVFTSQIDTYVHKKSESRYNLRNRKAEDSTDDADARPASKKARNPDETPEGIVGAASEVTDTAKAEPSRKRRRSDDTEEGEIVEVNDTVVTDSDPPAKKRKKNKHKPRRQKRAKSQAALDMLIAVLVPHYRPTKDIFIESKKEREARLVKQVARNKTTFMDLNEDCRRIIWEKVFENESYRFKCQRYCKRDSWKHMQARVPPSFGCLLINKQLGAEAAEEIYKSVRLEIYFEKLRPQAVQDFMDKIGESHFGQKCERIFFMKKFGLQRVNFGHFQRAKEIVSEHWTVEGEKNMDEYDYINNLIDPAYVLQMPKESKLRGFKQRKAWKDHKLAFNRYQAHLEDRCHPLMKDPNAEDFDEVVDRKKCCFDQACLNLEKTLFVITLKFKFGRVKGRHARHKEVWYDFYPEQRGKKERLIQSTPFKSRFHKKLPKKGGNASEGDGEAGEEAQV